jgi:hypothetical protein
LEKQFPYFRFNADREVGDIGLADAETSTQREMHAHTDSYMKDFETKQLTTKCVKFLVDTPCAVRNSAT